MIPLRLLVRESALTYITHLEGELGVQLRWKYWKRRLKHLGAGVRISPGVYFQQPHLISIGENAWIDRGVMLLAGRVGAERELVRVENPDYAHGPGEIVIGADTHIAAGALLSGIAAGLSVGPECTVGAGSALYAFSHHMRSMARPWDRSVAFTSMVAADRQCMMVGPITIGENAGIGTRSVILWGARIDARSFVSASSFVRPGTRVEENSVVAGNPARVVASRFAPFP